PKIRSGVNQPHITFVAACWNVPSFTTRRFLLLGGGAIKLLLQQGNKSKIFDSFKNSKRPTLSKAMASLRVLAGRKPCLNLEPQGMSMWYHSPQQLQQQQILPIFETHSLG
uniref:Polyprotein n=1 Tax=Macrostomum lignano TaxID=282301 RepID=A0A1I8GK15_9PLAT